MKQKRKKGFLGALIGGGVSLIGGLASSLIGKNAQEKAQRRQQIAQNRVDTYEMANNLSAAYGDQEYADEFAKKVTFKHGGVKRYNDRIKRNKKFSCGGRKKAEFGTEENSNINNNITGSVVSGVMSGVNNIASALINSSIDNKPIVKMPTISNVPKTEIKTSDYQQTSNSNNNIVNDNYVLANILNNPRMFKCGGKHKRK